MYNEDTKLQFVDIQRVNNSSKILQNLPIISFFFAIFLIFVFITLSKLNATWVSYLKQLDGPSLVGIQNDQSTEFSYRFSNFISGKFQKNYENSLNSTFPFRNWIIRIHNQIFYTLFSKSYMYSQTIIIGQKKYLFELPYIQKYFNLNKKQFTIKSFAQWADDLQILDSYFEKHGQKFIYLITPSKVSYYPEYLLKNLPATKCILPRPDYVLAKYTLDRSSIKYIDGSKIILANKKKYGKYLFPQGGTHWTNLGALLVTQALLDKIWQTLNMPQEKITYKYAITHTPNGTDVDLLNLANLLTPKMNYPVPSINIINPLKAKDKKQLKIALIGGSFLFQISKILIQADVFQQLDIYSYLIVNHLRGNSSTNPEFPFEVIPMNPDAKSEFTDIKKADIVILEENEENLRSNHFKLLLQVLLDKSTHYD